MIAPLSILYQDEFLVAIDKPAGMLVHPGRDAEGPEWVAMKRLRNELGRRVHPVHRLDRPTTGVLLFALDRVTAAATQQAFERRQVGKTYHAIVEGVTPEEWICDSPLASEPDVVPLAAHTCFRRLVVADAGSFSLDPSLAISWIEARPATGRFHQIRRHLLEAGHPIVGDFRYAGQDHSFRMGDLLGTGTRMLLHARALDLPHPRSGAMLHIEAPTNPDFPVCFPTGNAVHPAMGIAARGECME
jgi:tRNA pseudouridine65 synthase